MLKGETVMKVLKIDNSQGYFLTEEGDYELIDRLDKSALLRLVNLALEEGFEIDTYDEDQLRNQAHQIIYRSISEKLSDLHQRRQQFRDESEKMYLEEYEKYTV